MAADVRKDAIDLHNDTEFQQFAVYFLARPKGIRLRNMSQCGTSGAEQHKCPETPVWTKELQ
jgi:hypothetical protein